MTKQGNFTQRLLTVRKIADWTKPLDRSPSRPLEAPNTHGLGLPARDKTGGQPSQYDTITSTKVRSKRACSSPPPPNGTRGKYHRAAHPPFKTRVRVRADYSHGRGVGWIGAEMISYLKIRVLWSPHAKEENKKRQAEPTGPTYLRFGGRKYLHRATVKGKARKNLDTLVDNDTAHRVAIGVAVTMSQMDWSNGTPQAKVLQARTRGQSAQGRRRVKLVPE
ncbi:hypothetical protein Tco_1016068 [Tanacetum coccineum]|uniref:Uncharacterized protein n=1 Tax=Tanacetum coccineum TaxID=301880 RepID=A0ABQ5FML9_9ASTR